MKVCTLLSHSDVRPPGRLTRLVLPIIFDLESRIGFPSFEGVPADMAQVPGESVYFRCFAFLLFDQNLEIFRANQRFFTWTTKHWHHYHNRLEKANVDISTMSIYGDKMRSTWLLRSWSFLLRTDTFARDWCDPV